MLKPEIKSRRALAIVSVRDKQRPAPESCPESATGYCGIKPVKKIHVQFVQ